MRRGHLGHWVTRPPETSTMLGMKGSISEFELGVLRSGMLDRGAVQGAQR